MLQWYCSVLDAATLLTKIHQKLDYGKIEMYDWNKI